MLPGQWREYIENQGGKLNDNNEVEFDSNSNNPDFICDLSYLGVIEVSGEDRLTFLQGQLTNDFNQVTAEMSHLGG